MSKIQIKSNKLYLICRYAVAWYPIYRIPGGELHATFLTYHSLGHLVHRRPVFDYACTDPSIVSPVVGLVSYKDEVILLLLIALFYVR